VFVNNKYILERQAGLTFQHASWRGYI